MFASTINSCFSCYTAMNLASFPGLSKKPGFEATMNYA